MVVSTSWARWARFGLLGVILASRLVLGTIYSLVQPPLESNDETGHSAYVAYVAAHLALPPPGGELTPYFGEGHQPPLYYVVPGIIGHIFGIAGEYQPPMNPFFLSGNGEHGINAAVHIPAVEAWPWHDGLLLLHIARFWSVLLGVIAVWLTYIIGRWCFPRSPIVPLAGAAFAAFLPTSLGVTDAVTNDALVPVTFGLAFLCSLRLISEPRLRWAVLFGTATGMSLLTKNSALILLPYACCIFGLIWWKNRNWQHILWLACAFACIVLLVAGWWYLRNFLLYGHWITDRKQTSAIINSLGLQPKVVAYSLRESFAVRLIAYTFQSYWALLGWGTIAAPNQVYWGLFILSLLALFGLVRYVVGGLLEERRGILRRQWLVAGGAQEGRVPSPGLGAVGMLVFFSIAMIPEPLYRAIFYEAPTLVPGRYLFGALTTTSLLLGLGLSTLIKRWPWASLLAGAGLLGLAIWMIPAKIIPAYAAPRPLSAEAAAHLPHPVDVVYGGAMHLVGFDIREHSVAPGGVLHVTLYWQAIRPMHRAYTVGVHVVDALGHDLGESNGFPGHGNLGTPLWQVGQTYADRYSVPVARDVRGPILGHIVVGVVYQELTPTSRQLTHRTSLPLVATNSAGQPVTPLLGRFRIGGAPLVSRATPVAVFGGNFELLRATAQPELTQHRIGVQLVWESGAPHLPRYVVTVQLLSARGQLVAQARDAEPHGGLYPTDIWLDHEVVRDAVVIPIPDHMVAGIYTVIVGVYPLGRPTDRLSVRTRAFDSGPENTVKVGTFTLS